MSGLKASRSRGTWCRREVDEGARVTWHLKRDPSVESHPIAFEDIECIRQWRNGQMDVLRQSAQISSSGQLNWWRDVYLPESSGAEPVQLLFVLLRQGDLLAYGGTPTSIGRPDGLNSHFWRTRI